jgi:phosphatidylglycerophosphate synthase
VAAYLVLDCADGQLARLRGGGTVWGRVVDGIGDYLTAIAAHLGLVAWLARDLGLVAALAWGGAAAGSLAWASFQLDRYKRRYRGDQDDLEAVRREVEAARGVKRFFLRGFLPYAGAAVGGAPIPDRAAYQERVRLPMRLFLLAGPTTHMVVFALLAALGRPLAYAIAAVGPFNLLALTALLLQVRLERRAPPVVAT